MLLTAFKFAPRPPNSSLSNTSDLLKSMYFALSQLSLSMLSSLAPKLNLAFRKNFFRVFNDRPEVRLYSGADEVDMQ